MKKRILGQDGLEVSTVGLGCMGFSHAYGVPTEKSEAVRMIRTAFDMGYDFFDTAECCTGPFRLRQLGKIRLACMNFPMVSAWGSTGEANSASLQEKQP